MSKRDEPPQELDPEGMLLMHIYGEDFPWTEVDDRIIEALKAELRDEDVKLEDCGAPPEAIERFRELERRFKDAETTAEESTE